MRDIANNAMVELLQAHELTGAQDTDYGTADYIVAIGYPDIPAENDGRLYYLVVNKNTGVVEYSTAQLPDGIQAMSQLQDGLSKLRVVERSPSGVYQ